MGLSQKKYESNNRYIKAHYKRVPFDVPISFAETIKLEAQARQMSVNGFIRFCIQREIERDALSLIRNDHVEDAN